MNVAQYKRSITDAIIHNNPGVRFQLSTRAGKELYDEILRRTSQPFPRPATREGQIAQPAAGVGAEASMVGARPQPDQAAAGIGAEAQPNQPTPSFNPTTTPSLKVGVTVNPSTTRRTQW